MHTITCFPRCSKVFRAVQRAKRFNRLIFAIMVAGLNFKFCTLDRTHQVTRLYRFSRGRNQHIAHHEGILQVKLVIGGIGCTDKATHQNRIARIGSRHVNISGNTDLFNHRNLVAESAETANFCSLLIRYGIVRLDSLIGNQVCTFDRNILEMQGAATHSLRESANQAPHTHVIQTIFDIDRSRKTQFRQGIGFSNSDIYKTNHATDVHIVMGWATIEHSLCIQRSLHFRGNRDRRGIVYKPHVFGLRNADRPRNTAQVSLAMKPIDSGTRRSHLNGTGSLYARNAYEVFPFLGAASAGATIPKDTTGIIVVKACILERIRNGNIGGTIDKADGHLRNRRIQADQATHGNHRRGRSIRFNARRRRI